MATYDLRGVSPASFVAGGTIALGAAVKMDSTANQVVVTSAITDIVIGVALTSAVSGETVPVQTHGIVKVLSDGTPTSVGAEVMPKASGSGKASLSSGATAMSFGITRTVAAADGDFLEVELIRSAHGAANS